jgi:hypothetical protein
MIKTLFATTAIATTLGLAAFAQEASDPLVKEPEAQAPAELAPSAPAPATEAQSTEPAAPMGAEPTTETAEEPAAPMGTEPSTETAQEPAAPMPADPATETAEEPAAPMGTEPATETAQDPAGSMMAPDAGSEMALTPVAPADISADKLIGATIQTPDAENIASVDDVLMGADGSVESVVAQFGGFLGFGSNKVLLTLDEIEVLQDEAGTFVVQTDLTPESLEGRPEYTAEQ